MPRCERDVLGGLLVLGARAASAGSSCTSSSAGSWSCAVEHPYVIHLCVNHLHHLRTKKIRNLLATKSDDPLLELLREYGVSRPRSALLLVGAAWERLRGARQE